MNLARIISEIMKYVAKNDSIIMDYGVCNIECNDSEIIISAIDGNTSDVVIEVEND